MTIGIFDSGVGGLTVFREIARSLPDRPLIYLGDSARVPYGTKSADIVTRYAHEAANHLLQRGVEMLVVACNTATAAALPSLRERLSIPVIGVVEPGARAAVERTRGDDSSRTSGLERRANQGFSTRERHLVIEADGEGSRFT